MKKNLRLNLIFVFIIGIALFATLWFLRGDIRSWMDERKNADIPVAISRNEIEKRVQTSTVQVQISPTSSQKTTVTSSKAIVSSTTATPTVASSTFVSAPIVSKIPDSLNLDVPFVPQAPEKNWDQPWQDACEEAAILMMDAYYKDYKVSVLRAKEDILKMVAWQESVDRNWGRSIEMEKIQKIFTDYLTGYTASKLHVIENPTIDQIKKYLANGQPVYVVADGKILPNPHFQNGGPEYHALVIRGYTKDSFITNDPGTQFGQNFKYKYNDLMNAIHDWNVGDVIGGRRVVLVIE
jgi:hypothetical protein